jgi:hypothetical protein
MNLLDGADAQVTRAKAIVAFSAMAGAVGLARAASDNSFPDEILDTVRHFLPGKFSSSRSAKART